MPARFFKRSTPVTIDYHTDYSRIFWMTVVAGAGIVALWWASGGI